jgi:hypothetical protein
MKFYISKIKIPALIFTPSLSCIAGYEWHEVVDVDVDDVVDEVVDVECMIRNKLFSSILARHNRALLLL